MSNDEIEKRLADLEAEESRLRRRLNELEDVAQNAPGSHRPGKPSIAATQAEREIQTIVLGLIQLDRRRQELTVAMSLTR
jgi:hypothetical protein